MQLRVTVHIYVLAGSFATQLPWQAVPCMTCMMHAKSLKRLAAWPSTDATLAVWATQRLVVLACQVLLLLHRLVVNFTEQQEHHTELNHELTCWQWSARDGDSAVP
jgi:hypothetical protein